MWGGDGVTYYIGATICEFASTLFEMNNISDASLYFQFDQHI